MAHSDEVINLSSDERPQDPQVFISLPSVHRTLKVFTHVGSKHHLLVLGQELPQPSTHLSKGGESVLIYYSSTEK